MSDKLFLIAIGGTGMRCLESFVHLCAAGLFDNHEINVLTLDTDQTNGNKARVENLIDLYNSVKTEAEPGGLARTNTFFSAKINLYKFYTDYSQPRNSTLAALAQTNNFDARDDNQDLSDLLFERDSVQQFKLDHGYRAQTHLGSMLMYHGIIDAARNAKRGGENIKFQEKQLTEFLKLLNQNAATARVFVFGSIFGGTGASSIPVIPRALSEALKIQTEGAVLDQVLFASTLLTDYFSFPSPKDETLRREKVIASSNNFALNSQAALSFYNNDDTVKGTYKRMYHIGWPNSLKIDYSDGGEQVKTGGAEQKNPCHIVEMMCAAAAYDFFNEKREVLTAIKEAEYVYRTVATDDAGVLSLSGKSFVEDGDLFENKIGAFLSFAHLVLSRHGGAKEGTVGTTKLIEALASEKITDYNAIPNVQREQIDQYLKEFAYKFVDGNVSFGWIYQVQSSIRNGKFIFAPEAFRQTVSDLSKIDAGAIFADEKHHWDKSGWVGDVANRRFDTLISNMRNKNLPEEKQGTSLRERFLAHMYNAITISQHF